MALAAAACGLLAWALIIPAASARTMMFPDPGGAGGTTPSTSVPATASGVPGGGGMAGWQITLIAVGAAMVAATAAVLLDRARAARRAASATSA